MDLRSPFRLIVRRHQLPSRLKYWYINLGFDLSVTFLYNYLIERLVTSSSGILKKPFHLKAIRKKALALSPPHASTVVALVDLTKQVAYGHLGAPANFPSGQTLYFLPR